MGSCRCASICDHSDSKMRPHVDNSLFMMIALGSHLSPATAKAVGTDWLAQFRDKYTTPLADAVILL